MVLLLQCLVDTVLLWCFSQPRMYQVIKKHTPVDELYAKELIEAQVVSSEDYKVHARPLLREGALCIHHQCMHTLSPAPLDKCDSV